MNLIIKELYKITQESNYRLIILPQTKEKYISVSFGNRDCQ